MGEADEFDRAEADASEDLADDFPFVRAEKDEVAFLDLEALLQGGFFGVGEKFDDGRLPFAIFAFDEGKALGAELFGHGGEFLDLTGGDLGEAFGVEGADHAAAVEGAAEDLELGAGEDVADVDNFLGPTGVGLVAAEAVHRFAVGQAREGCGNLDAVGCTKDGDKHLLDEGVEVLGRDETHFDVGLGEFRLAVGP